VEAAWVASTHGPLRVRRQEAFRQIIWRQSIRRTATKHSVGIYRMVLNLKEAGGDAATGAREEYPIVAIF
jgi:hypothetical protein